MMSGLDGGSGWRAWPMPGRKCIVVSASSHCSRWCRCAAWGQRGGGTMRRRRRKRAGVGLALGWQGPRDGLGAQRRRLLQGIRTAARSGDGRRPGTRLMGRGTKGRGWEETRGERDRSRSLLSTPGKVFIIQNNFRPVGIV